MVEILLVILAVFIAYKYGKNRSANNSVITISHIPVKQEDRDHWEGSFSEAGNPLPVHTNISFSYTDGSNKTTDRTVEVREFDCGLYGGILIGHCQLRDATRTFRFERMKRIVDIDSGEVINDIQQYLQKLYDESPEAAMKILLETFQDALRILLYLAKADGRLSAKEKLEILAFCHSVSNDTRIQIDTLNDALSQIQIPTFHAFKLCCGRLAKLEKKLQNEVVNFAERIAATKKNISLSEQEALEYIRRRLSLET